MLFAIGTQALAAVSIQTTALPNGILKDSYLGVITVAGGCTPYKWKVASGSLPASVAMKTSADTKSLTLTGTPTKAASYSFTVAATACGGATARDTLNKQCCKSRKCSEKMFGTPLARV
jgi:hypothetical protein